MSPAAAIRAAGALASPRTLDDGADSDAPVRYIVRLAMAPLNSAPTRTDAAR